MTLRAFQCFSAGTHVDMHGRAMTFSEGDISAIAAGYSPSRRAAPLVLGHPADDSRAPHYGVVRGLVAEGQSLFCIGDCSSDLLELVRAGRYKNVSASLHLPGTKDNPDSNYYLRHVGFLGAVAPAVKGMQPLGFAVELDTRPDAAMAACEASFAAWNIPKESQEMQLYRVANDLRRAAPSLSFIAAASRAERALSR